MLPAMNAADSVELPDAPEPQTSASLPQSQRNPETQPGFPPVAPRPRPIPPFSPRQHPGIPAQFPICQPNLSSADPAKICCAGAINPFQRFLDSTPHPLTPRQKFTLAYKNVIDPFNLGTIVVVSGVSTAADSHSAYGPGFKGFSKNVGVAYTETMVGQFFGTFLIPSITHQDPHYYRLPNASFQRRFIHCITQVVWAQSDYGTGMPNYSVLVGSALSDALGNLYVPGREKSWGAGVARWGTAIATDPIDNFITEFVPDLARRINFQIVIVQRVINQVAKQGGGSGGTAP
jgi:hypothetical protein